MNRHISAGAKTVLVLVDAANDLRDSSGETADAIEAEVQELLKLSTAADQASTSTEAFTSKTTAAGAAVKEVTKEMKALATALGAEQVDGWAGVDLFSRESVDQTLRDLARAGELTESVMTATEQRAVAQAEYNDLLERGLISQETYNRLLGEGSEILENDWGRAFEAIAAAFGSLLVQLVRGTEDAGAAIQNTARQLGSQLGSFAGGIFGAGNPFAMAAGGAIGGFIGDLFGGMFNSGPAWGPSDVGASGDRITALTSTGRELASAIQDTLDTLLGAMGASLENLAQFQVNIRGTSEGFAVTVGNLTHTFSDAATAINYAVRQLIIQSDIVGVSEEVAAAFQQAARRFSDIDEFTAEIGRITSLVALDLNQLTGAALELSEASQELSRHLQTAADYGLSAAGAVAAFGDSVSAIGEGIMARARSLAGQSLDPEQRLRREFEQLREQARAYNAQLRVEIAARQAEVVAIDAQIAGLQAAAAALRCAGADARGRPGVWP
jgi:methyl-accepting chemotaxis protein